MKILLALVVLLCTLAGSVADHEGASLWLRRVQEATTTALMPLAPPCCDPLQQPGTNGNNICKEGSACCPDGTWACSIGDGKTFICNGVEVVNPAGPICGEKCCGKIDRPCKDVRCCPDGIWTCPNENGNYVCGGIEVAEPSGKPCPPCCDKLFTPSCLIGSAACCPDGNWVCPDSATGLYPCGPVQDPKGAICDSPCCDPLLEPGVVLQPCEFGHYCHPNGYWQCIGRPMPTGPIDEEPTPPTAAPSGKVCEKPCCNPTQDLRCLIGTPACCPNGQWACPDGVTGLYPCDLVNPDGPLCDNGCCEVEAIPDCGDRKPACCPEGKWTCPEKGGGYVCTDLAFVDPPTGKVCRECCPEKEIRTCPTGKAQCCSDGTWVCPSSASGQYKCGDSFYQDLKGYVCDACCDPALKPPGPFPCRGEGLACCPGGTWACSIGDGKTFNCGGEEVIEPKGKECGTSCCEPSNMPFCFIGTAACCPDGNWSCPNGENGPYQCGNVEVIKPTGTVCGCCDPAREPGTNGNPFCIEGHACCPDGTWTCSIGDGVTFVCGGVDTVKPQGKICEKKGCCEPSEMPRCRIGNAACCPNGSWSCPSGENGPYLCGSVEVDKPTGTLCACCDPATEPGANGNPFCIEGHACCPDGTWSCSIGDGVTFSCLGEQVQKPQGHICECCNPDQAPICLIGSAGCCPDGSWACPNGENGPYNCGTSQIDFPSGNICGCCDPAQVPKGCFEGVACCPDGKWSCSIGDAMTYPCGGSLVINPTGKVCKCCDPGKEPGKFGNPLCREGHACCPNTGTWSCSIGDAKTFPCGNINIVNPDGVACTSVVDPGSGNPWTDAVLFNKVKSLFPGVNVQRCLRRQFPPNDGAKCGKTNKTCFFGQQTCGDSGTYPEINCVCSGDGLSKGTWRCKPESCQNNTSS